MDIEGSGELNTVITSEVCPGGPDSGTVEGADDSEMRFFTARNTCSEDGERPAILNDSASVRLTHVTAEATGGPQGQNEAVVNVEANVTMIDVTATASGASDGTNNGVLNEDSTVTMTDVTATASGGTPGDTDNYGVVNIDATVTIKQSKLSGGPNINNEQGGAALWQHGGTTKIALSQLVEGFNFDSGTLLCFDNYDENMAAVTCPPS